MTTKPNPTPESLNDKLFALQSEFEDAQVIEALNEAMDIVAQYESEIAAERDKLKKALDLLVRRSETLPLGKLGRNERHFVEALRNAKDELVGNTTIDPTKATVIAEPGNE